MCLLVCCFLWLVEYGSLDLVIDRLCGFGRVIVFLSFSCRFCKMIVWGGVDFLCDVWVFFGEGCYGVGWWDSIVG